MSVQHQRGHTIGHGPIVENQEDILGLFSECHPFHLEAVHEGDRFSPIQAKVT